MNLRVLLYRNYYLQHRKGVLLGFFSRRLDVTGPYVPLFDPARVRASGADYLVFHRDIEKEVRAYFAAVDPGESEALRVKRPTLKQVVRLQSMLGDPFYESDDRGSRQ